MTRSPVPSTAWIIVPRWREFQHYDPAKRDVKWVKNYTRLLSNDDYLALSATRRALLHGLWLVYGLACTCPRDREDLDCTCLRLDVQLLNRRLGLAAKMADYESLNHAGFIVISASNVLATRYQSASPKRARVEGYGEEREEPFPNPDREARGAKNGHADLAADFPLPELRSVPR